MKDKHCLEKDGSEEPCLKEKALFQREEILNNIELPENLDKLIINSIEEGYGRMGKNTFFKNKAFENKVIKNQSSTRTALWKRAAVIGGASFAGLAISMPVKAFFLSFVNQRMEQIPREEIENTTNVPENQAVAADTSWKRV